MTTAPGAASMTHTRQVMMMQDDHVDAIRREIERTHEPVEIRGEGGRVAVFKIRRGKLYGYERTASGFVRNEVMKESEMRRMMQRPDVSRPDPVELEKAELRTKLREEHPEMSPEKLEEHVDIIVEARKTVLALLKQGVPPTIAPQLVSHALRLNDTDKGRLQNMAASYAERRRAEDPSGNYVVHVSPPTDPIPSRNPVADPMSGVF